MKPKPCSKGRQRAIMGSASNRGRGRHLSPAGDSTPFQGFRDGLLQRSQDISVLQRETGRVLNCLDWGYFSHFNPKFIPGPRYHCCYPTYIITSYIYQACCEMKAWGSRQYSFQCRSCSHVIWHNLYVWFSVFFPLPLCPSVPSMFALW